ncbi:hypothetical protein [Streptobacillus moniliformis]|uniref:Uncharacterized protein n=1 Tax=Streptobacillus moniliformis (strain ATCC 14647 / DSM 12112 / NCTC 10651 / 9901) TaxID=519441 RepID=D1AYB8_STRM9|nr:hypothetical protein [Streptobacillus moniliformis]ACZ01294.1 hypothetical protein Smon_0826 [Streptobacillus moniliformis DSM 12112]QXW66032.1 hypothetical protein KX935_01970 [Streptobacillus moniliformis]SQA13548.1 Uncharacterised protein [Streptobacillus moniliformis]
MEINKELYNILLKEYEKENELLCGCEILSFEDYIKFRITELEKKE